MWEHTEVVRIAKVFGAPVKISLSSNLPALKAARLLGESTQSVVKSLERLSSGMRINTAVDDPAGLALANQMETDKRLATVATRNISDGLSLLDVSISAATELDNIFGKMVELSTQYYGSTLTTAQRSAIQSEFSALNSEVGRVARSAFFNKTNLLDSATGQIYIQAGIRGTEDDRILLNDIGGTWSITNLSHDWLNDSIGGQVQQNRDQIQGVRGDLMASRSRLEHAVSNISKAGANFAIAEGGIRDIDAASELSNLVKGKIAQDAGTAIMAQANIQPQVALNLLEGSLQIDQASLLAGGGASSGDGGGKFNFGGKMKIS